MYPDNTPIIFKTPKDFDNIVIHFVHDLHYGHECFDLQRWNAVKSEILSEPNHYVIWVGDLMENAIPDSKGDVLTQMYSPQDQKEFVIEQFKELKKQTIAIVPGNHEYNRTTKKTGMYPLYDCAVIAGLDDKYRNAFAVVDIYVGNGKDHHMNRQHEYIGFIKHQSSDLKKFGFGDILDNFDFMVSGHDHEPKDRPRMKLSYDRQRKVVNYKSVECLNCGSFLNYGGYGARGPYRPLSDKMYKLVLGGSVGESWVETIGYYPKIKAQ